MQERLECGTAVLQHTVWYVPVVDWFVTVLQYIQSSSTEFRLFAVVQRMRTELSACLLFVPGCSCSSAPAVAVDPVGQPGLLCQPVVLAGSSSSGSRATVQLDPATYSYQGCYCKAPLTAVTQQQDGWTVSMACAAKQVRCVGLRLTSKRLSAKHLKGCSESVCKASVKAHARLQQKHMRSVIRFAVMIVSLQCACLGGSWSKA
jgi:hypothetical protein